MTEIGCLLTWYVPTLAKRFAYDHGLIHQPCRSEFVVSSERAKSPSSVVLPHSVSSITIGLIIIMSSLLDPEGYEYHHGSGQHLLISADKDKNRPKYSFLCFLCYCVDCFVLLLVIGFLVFAGWLCYYLYNMSDGGQR